MTSMKATVLSLFAILMLAACSSPEKLMDFGDYDQAIQVTVKRLAGKKKKKEVHVLNLEEAFARANSRDLNTIDALKEQNRPENWVRIYDLYDQIQRRQNLVSPLTPLYADNGYLANFQFLRVQQEQEEAAQGAAQYYYDRGNEFMRIAQNEGDKAAARTAYNNYGRSTDYVAAFANALELRRQAYELGISHVQIQFANQSNVVVPRSLERELIEFASGDLNSKWQRFYHQAPTGTNMDYTVVVSLANVRFSPERVSERAYRESRVIEDGWEYVLDENGNVAKDSLGNDIKQTREVTVIADVLEVYQEKVAGVTSRIDIMDNRTQQRLATEQFNADAVFSNYASTFRGDRRALSKETLCNIGNSPQPFPTNESLLVQAAYNLKPMIKRAISDHRSIF